MHATGLKTNGGSLCSLQRWDKMWNFFKLNNMKNFIYYWILKGGTESYSHSYIHIHIHRYHNAKTVWATTGNFVSSLSFLSLLKLYSLCLRLYWRKRLQTCKHANSTQKCLCPGVFLAINIKHFLFFFVLPFSLFLPMKLADQVLFTVQFVDC